MQSEAKMETSGNRFETLLQTDPLVKPKKMAMMALFSVMVATMVLAFAAFHWLYAEYFSYAASNMHCA